MPSSALWPVWSQAHLARGCITGESFSQDLLIVRVHRSALVNLNFVQALFREGADEGTLLLSTGQQVRTSKAGRDRLEASGGF